MARLFALVDILFRSLALVCHLRADNCCHTREATVSTEKVKAEPVRKTKVAQSHDNDELPPERAADLARREAELKQLASGALVERFTKKPPK